MASTGGLAKLLGQSTIDDHEEVLQAANAALKTSKGDTEAAHVKAIALLKLDRYDEALQTFEDGGAKLKERAALEYAYALYRTGKPDQAAKVAADGKSRASRHVEAQAAYRSEDFRKAAELYSTLSGSSSHVSNEQVDLRINSGAVDAQLEWAHQGHLARSRKPGREDLEAFETAYNAACGSIARGELAQAEVLLKRSKDICNALDDLSEDEKRAELLPITVQQVYVLTRLGRVDEAQKLSKGVKPDEISDQTSKGIARLNALAASGSDNPFLLQRLAQLSSKIPVSDRPFAFQRSAFQRNENSISLGAQKFGGSVRSSKAVSKSQPAPSLDPTVNTLSALSAAAVARQKTGRDALKLVLPELEKRPKDIGLILIIVQLYVLTGNNDTATALLEKFLERLEQSKTPTDADARFAPGLVGIMLSLYNARGQSSHVRTELAKASKHWRHRSKSQEAFTPPVANLLKTAAGRLLESESKEDQGLAYDILADLASSSTSDTFVQAALLAAHAGDSEIQKDAKQGADLTPVERLVKGIDIDALENAGVARPPQIAPAKTAKRPAEDSTASKKKRKIKPCKLPKDFDPAKQPDPERWLPVRDRSSYKPKGKKGKQRANMLAQGAVEENSRPATPSTEVLKGAGGGGKNAGKKKKGKGGKW